MIKIVWYCQNKAFLLQRGDFMAVFGSTFSQMIFLMILIFIGFILVRANLIPHSTEGILSKLESYIFIPASVLGTFMTQFTTEKLSSAGGFFISGGVFVAIIAPISILIAL